jgi:hypothetical protein
MQLKKLAFANELAENLQLVANAAFSGNPLRGGAPNAPDVAGKFARDMLRMFATLGDLEAIHAKVKTSYSALFGTFVLGALGLVLAVLYAPSRSYVTFLGALLILAQIGVAVRIRMLGKQLETYEKTT